MRANFKFYTSSLNYATFKAFFNYLQPATSNFFMYAGSKNSQHTTEAQAKRGTQRSLTPEQELFMVLLRLRSGLLGLDITDYFGISQAQYSRIETAWLAFIYPRLFLEQKPQHSKGANWHFSCWAPYIYFRDLHWSF